ncbi:uncharacterized protein LOC100176194 [Ciona intestinalis]
MPMLRYQENVGCTDINECTELAPCKIGQVCRNLWGSYLCVCPRGYRFDARTGVCNDIDECGMGYCGNGEKCINTIGSFNCLCSPGMVKIGRFCRDVNECTHSPCDSNQYCINSRGSYHCRCKAGYSDAGDRSCVDTDECAQGMCQALGETCRNTVGSYECVCDRGFTKDPTTNGRYCMDVNECDLDMCSENSECINTQGSYFCRCHRGYTKHQGVCVDNQECSLGEGNKCQWRCRNTPGAFECECPVGYDKLDYSCNDINECDRGASVCGPSDTCVNTRGGHKCMEQITCPDNNFYRKLMRTDEFRYRQITTNICRRKRCRRVTSNNETFAECKAQSLSISYHYIDIPTGLKLPSNLLKISFSPRRRRQQYHFQIAQGEENAFSLRQPSMYRPQAYLVLTGELTGPSQHMVKVDISTYNRRGEMRDNRMLTITVLVSEYTF